MLLQKSYLAQMVHVRLILYREEGRLDPHHQDEDQTEDDVTTIGDDVVEILVVCNVYIICNKKVQPFMVKVASKSEKWDFQ